MPAALPRGLVAAGVAAESLDTFIWERQTRTLAVSGMAFMDAESLDLERLRQCYINIVSPDGRMVPFCAYNLTARDGTALYRK